MQLCFQPDVLHYNSVIIKCYDIFCLNLKFQLNIGDHDTLMNLIKVSKFDSKLEYKIIFYDQPKNSLDSVGHPLLWYEDEFKDNL